MTRRLLAVLLSALSLMAHAQSGRGSYRISGRVVSSITGDALASTRVELLPTSGAEWVKAALTLKDGKFAFERLAPGKYQLYAERGGFARQGFDEHRGGFLSAIVVGPGIDSENLVFRLQPGATITGIVSDEYGEVVRDAQVMLFRREVRNGKLGTYPVGQALSDDRGIYKFSPLMAGTYYVMLSARPWYAQNAMRFGPRMNPYRKLPGSETDEALNVAFPLTFFSDTTDLTSASAINLRTGELLRGDFNLRSVQAITIRINVMKGPQPPVALTQRIFDDFELHTQGMQRSSSGDTLVISGFAPGRYLVKVEAQRETDPERSQMMDLYSDTTVDLGRITGEATASITGLAHAEGVSLKDPILMFRNLETGDIQRDRVGEDGKFKLEAIPAGKYEVSVANSASVYLANMAASNAKVSGRTLDIPAGADVRVAIILAKGVGEIKGTAIRDDRGLSGTMVLLVPENPGEHASLFRRDQSDSDGTFTLSQVVPGRYTLLAIENGWELEWTDMKAMQPYLAKGQSVQVEPNGKYDLKVAVQAAK